MKMHQPVWLKPGVWGVVLGALGTMIIGFSWLGWTLGSTADRAAQQRADLAVTAALTPICVQNFMKQSDASKKLIGLQGVETWKQTEFVEQGGWATMPGSSAPAQGVAGACAQALMKTKARAALRRRASDAG
jgi:hypothetical protein